mmetsp:Transcript_55338/g.132540  ORF Transcript_55338/g.132540 Transcript_55338/m.132540 type:complete len:392 (-) Transcript_55338:2752-3927(-)
MLLEAAERGQLGERGDRRPDLRGDPARVRVGRLEPAAARAREEEAPLVGVDERVALHHLDAHEEGEEQLVRLEERAADVHVERVREVVVEAGEAHGHLVALLAVVDGLHEEVGEPRHRVLVHGVDLAHVGHAEEEQRAAEGDGPVLVARLVDDDLGGRGLVGLDRDLVTRHLGLRERVDQPLVVEDVALRLGEQLEDRRLDVLELPRHLGVLDDQVVLGLLQVGPLLVDDHREQLVLQPALGHGEVDQRALRLQLGDVVRVRQLGLQVEPEERPVGDVVGLVTLQRHVDLLVAQLDDDLAPLVDEGAAHHRLDDRVDGIAQVVDEQWQSLSHGAVDLVEVVLLRELQRDQPIGGLVLAHPRDALQLRVDDQREARAVGDDRAVFDAQPVGR